MTTKQKKMMIRVPHDYNVSKLSWTQATFVDGFVAMFRCPNGHTSVMTNHKIDNNGFVTGSVKCPMCEFHEYVILENWVKIKEQAYNG